jgi:hypothetical protein
MHRRKGASYPDYLFRKIATIIKDYIEKFEN